MAVETIPVVSREAWLEARKQDVTASDVAAVFGLHPFKSRFQLWCEKAGVSKPQNETRLMRRGRWLEDAVLAACREAHPDWTIVKATTYYRDPVLRIGATPDAYADTPDGPILIQCKAIEGRAFDAWGDDPPLAYQLQVNTEAMLSGHTRAILAVLVLRPFDASYHEFLIPVDHGVHSRISDAVPAFWDSIRSGITPEPDYVEDGDLISAMFPPSVSDVEVDLTGDNRMPELVAEWRDAKASVKAASERVDALKAEIVHKLNGATKATLPGFVVTNRMQHRSAYEVKATSFPVLKVTATKEA